MTDTIGFIRVILPRYTEAGQRKAMDAHSIDRLVIEGGKAGKRGAGSRADLVRMVRSGTVVAVQHLHLLADPKAKRKRGGTRGDLWKAVDAIEHRGGVLWELYSGLRSDTREGRDAMTRAAVESLARGRHKTSASGKRGRPKADFTEQQMKDARAIWRNVKDYPTWDDARDALSEIVSASGTEFTTSRAFALWKRRT